MVQVSAEAETLVETSKVAPTVEVDINLVVVLDKEEELVANLPLVVAFKEVDSFKQVEVSKEVDLDQEVQVKGMGSMVQELAVAAK